MRTPFVATRVGDVRPGGTVADPALFEAPTMPALRALIESAQLLMSGPEGVFTRHRPHDSKPAAAVRPHC